jgi:hypothetical protein
VAVDDLAMQVAEVDHVVVDDANGADARRGQVERGRRAQTASTDEHHPGGQ